MCHMDIWRICSLHFAFCINLNDLNFVVSYFTYFPFCIFFSLVQQIFEKENCCMELNSVCLPQSRWDDMHNICVRNSSASKLEIPLMFADVCTCTVQCALCTVQCFGCVHCAFAVCSHSAGQVSQGYKGNNSNSARNAKETSSKSTCMQHSLQCIS